MNKKRLVFQGALALAAALAACTLGPDYRRPELPVPAAYKSATAAEEAPPRLGRDWWRLFHDADLDRLEQDALRGNPGLQAAMARVLEARAAAAAVKSQFYPVLTLNPAASRTRTPAGLRSGAAGSGISPAASPTPTPTPGPTPAGGGSTAAASTTRPTRTNLFQIPFDLTYEIDIWGRVRRSYEAAQAQARSSAYDMEVVRQTLLADVAQDYFNLRSFEEQGRITRRNVELYRQQLELTQAQFKAGLASEVNVLQTRTLLESTLAQELELERQRTDLEHALAILVGRPPAEFALGVSTRASPPPPAVPAGLPASLLRRRPDVAEAEENLVAANAQVGAAVAALFPTVRLTGTAGFESTSVGNLLDSQNGLWSIGASVSAPLFEGGLLRANLRQARARTTELIGNYRTALLGALRDVEDSLTDLHLRAAASQDQTRAVEAARQSLDLTQVQYRAGLASYLQVIDADRTLLANELTAAQTEVQRQVSTVLLMKALGGGWDTLAAAGE